MYYKLPGALPILFLVHDDLLLRKMKPSTATALYVTIQSWLMDSFQLFDLYLPRVYLGSY